MNSVKPYEAVFNSFLLECSLPYALKYFLEELNLNAPLRSMTIIFFLKTLAYSIDSDALVHKKITSIFFLINESTFINFKFDLIKLGCVLLNDSFPLDVG